MNAIELIAALKGADEETAMELVERLQCGEIDCSVLPTGKDNAVQQAQVWAQEARTQKGIMDEIGKLVGCANDWEMVSAVKAALSANGGEGWYCAHCECGVDPSEVTFNEAHTVCGRIITHDDPPKHPTPPSVAVPEGWIPFPTEAWLFLTGEGPLAGRHFGDIVCDDKTGRDKPFWWRSHIRHMLTAAPSPDHSGGVNKLVTPKLFKAFHASLCRRFGYTHDEQYWWRDLVSLEEHIAAKVADHIADAGKVVTGDRSPDYYEGYKDGWNNGVDTPSVPENEIKALALEEYADQLDAVFANAQEAGATDCPAWHAGQFAKDARKQAARLRTAGDEGEARPTHNGGESE